MAKKFLLSLMPALFVAASGCYGPFALTKKLHKWNAGIGQQMAQNASNKKQKKQETRWATEGVFLAFVILPVYDAAILADAVVLNSMQFWTGRPPLKN